MACGREFLSPGDGDAITRDCVADNPCPLCKELALLRSLLEMGLELRQAANLPASSLSSLWRAWEASVEKALG